MAVDVDTVAAAHRARDAATRAAVAARAARLREGAARAAVSIASEAGARRVWLFGSLAWGEPHEASDVDLLIEGAAPATWQRACAIAEDLVRGARVDVVYCSDAPAELVRRVHEQGVLLHDAG